MAEQEMLPVEECDRETFAVIVGIFPDHSRRQTLNIGGFDRDWRMRAIAQHRLAATKAADERVRELREHLAEQITHIETRIQDGREMGAAVWRIALEDIVRENRAALAEAGGRHA